jgi:hypothetical protein
MRFRVIGATDHDGDPKFLIQRRWLWFWSTVKTTYCGSFRTVEEGQQIAIEHAKTLTSRDGCVAWDSEASP